MKKLQIIFTRLRRKIGLIIVFLIILAVFFFADIFIYLRFVKASESGVITKKLKNFTVLELAKYDGTNPKLPIYMALDGKVYDVSKGRKYYKPGAVYHFLVGRDSSTDLHAVMVDKLIKLKYPVVGILRQEQ